MIFYFKIQIRIRFIHPKRIKKNKNKKVLLDWEETRNPKVIAPFLTYGHVSTNSSHKRTQQLDCRDAYSGWYLMLKFIMLMEFILLKRNFLMLILYYLSQMKEKSLICKSSINNKTSHIIHAVLIREFEITFKEWSFVRYRHPRPEYTTACAH